VEVGVSERRELWLHYTAEESKKKRKKGRRQKEGSDKEEKKRNKTKKSNLALPIAVIHRLAHSDFQLISQLEKLWPGEGAVRSNNTENILENDGVEKRREHGIR
jgi:hypothetical protein